jgi:hypothetical protein
MAPAEDSTSQALARIEDTLKEMRAQIAPLLADHVTRADLDGLRNDMAKRDAQADERYYSRRELDPLLRQLRGGIRGARSAIKAMQTAKAKEWQTLAIQGAAIAAFIYTVLNIAHQYIK